MIEKFHSEKTYKDTARLFIGITAYHRFEFALIAEQLAPCRNILLELVLPGENRKPSKYDELFLDRSTLTIERYFFHQQSERKLIDERLAAIAARHSIKEILVAQDLDARMQYCATFFRCPVTIVEDGFASYIQTVDPWRVAKRLATYRLFLGAARYPNWRGIGYFPAERYFAFDSEHAFPRVLDRQRVIQIEIPSAPLVEISTEERRALIVITQPLREVGVASEEDENEILNALGCIAASLGIALLIRSHPGESASDAARRAECLRRHGAMVDSTSLSRFEVIEEAFVGRSVPPIFGFHSTALLNARRINPKSRVLSAVNWLSSAKPRVRQAYVDTLAKAGVEVLSDLQELRIELQSLFGAKDN